MGECTIHKIDANKYYDDGISLPVNEATPVENPLTFEAKTAGTTVTFNCITGISAQYRFNDGSWQPYTSNTSITLANVGDKVSFRGNNVALAISKYPTSTNSSRFSCNNNCYVYGSVMSLLYPTGDAAVATSFPEGSQYTFSNLFYQAKISLHPDKALLLPATQLTGYCYYSMFYATALTQAPVLPATTLAPYCYYEMFSGANLVTAPYLPATVMAPHCYERMFYQCSSLTTGTVMRINEVAESCCYQMFGNCAVLASVPYIELSATTLAPNCYYAMFADCRALTSVPELPATTLANNCYLSMFSGCRALVSVPLDLLSAATTMADGCYNGMFSNCQSLKNVPNLPATELAVGCYRSMFASCGELETVPQNLLPATTLANNCYYSMFQNTAITEAPILPAIQLVTGCYMQMFNGCRSLNKITCLATTGISTANTNRWVNSVATSGTFTKAAGVTTWSSGVNGIPSGWTVVEATP